MENKIEFRAEMNKMVENKIAKPLHFDEVDSLIGKTIRVINYGYAGQDTVCDIKVGGKTTELEYYRNLNEECFKNDKYSNRAEYWESYMTKEQLDQHKRLVLVDADGNYTYCFEGMGGFVCMGDWDRLCYYIVLD